MVIAPDLLEDVVQHAQRDAPDECSGLIGVRDGVAVKVQALENLAHSPFRFEVDGMELHRALTAMEDGGVELGAIYHSHTRSEPFPSQTDVNFAAHWPGVEWLIVGLAAGEPTVRSFLIDDGVVTEVDVTHGA
jgi:[CysO sulfur-carrier protein]-S-L-cysteine hydrolase